MTSLPPIGSDLSIHQLLAAALWKTEQHADLMVSERMSGSHFVPLTLEQSGDLVHSTQRLLVRLGDQHNMLVPINRLPIETLTHILYFVQDEHESVMRLFPPNEDQTRHLLAHWLEPFTRVCQHWRQVAFANPWFWRDLWVGKNMLMANLFWQQSLPLPISIAIISRIDDADQNDPNFRDFWIKVEQNIERVEGLALHLPNVFESGALNDFLHRAFSNVRFLSLNCDQDAWQGDLVATHILAQKLTSLVLSNFHSLPRQLLQGLSRIYLSFCDQMDIEAFLPILQSSPTLEDLFIEGPCPSARRSLEEYQHLEIVNLPQLHTLTLDHVGSPNDHTLFLLHKINFSSFADLSWSSVCRTIPEIPFPPQFLEDVKSMLIIGQDDNIFEGTQFNHTILQRNSQVMEHTRNVRCLAVHKDAARDNYGRNSVGDWPDHFPRLQKCHLPAICATSSLLYGSETSASMYPELDTLYFWLDPEDRVEDLFRDGLKLPGVGDLVAKLKQGGQADWETSDLSCTIVVRFAAELEAGMEPFTWDWMLAESASSTYTTVSQPGSK